MNQILRYLIIGAAVFIGASLLIGIIAIGISILVPVLLVGLVLYYGIKLYYRTPWLQKLFSKNKKTSSSHATYYEMDKNGKIISEKSSVVTIIEPDQNNKRR